jgi:hypothetical protein
MDNEAQSHIALASWTIKNMPVEVRQEAVHSAARAGLSVAQWLAHAVRTQSQLDSGMALTPPAPAALPAPPATAAPVLETPALSHMTELLRETRNAFVAAGLKMPEKIAAMAGTLTVTVMAEAKQSSKARAKAARGAKEAPPALEGPANGATLMLEHTPEA